jgi:hypothetical protein
MGLVCEPTSSGHRARGSEAVSHGGGIGTLVLYIDCPIANKRPKDAHTPAFSNKALPVGLPDALIFSDGILGKTEFLGILDTIPCNAVLIVCVHRFGHSTGVTGLMPSFSTASCIVLHFLMRLGGVFPSSIQRQHVTPSYQGAASVDHPHVRVLNIIDLDNPMPKSAVAAAAATADLVDPSSISPPPAGLIDVARGGGGLARHVLAAVAGAQARKCPDVLLEEA